MHPGHPECQSSLSAKLVARAPSPQVLLPHTRSSQAAPRDEGPWQDTGSDKFYTIHNAGEPRLQKTCFKY